MSPSALVFQIFVLLLVFWIALYFYFTRKFDHWKKKKVPYAPPIPFFGNAFDVITLRKSIGDLTRHIYESTTQPFIGFFVFDEPCLLVRDLELIKRILIKDFDVFSNRSVSDNKKIDPVGSFILFVLKTPEWREMRRKISPIFTTGKMKSMFQLLDDASENMVEYLKKHSNNLIDTNETTAKYSTDAISSSAFGISANCFKHEDSEFRKVSRRVFNWETLERTVAMTAWFLAPNLVKLFRLKFIDTYSTEFLKNVFWKMMHEREELKFVRNDLLDILIELKKQGEFNNHSKEDSDRIVAQAVQFFVAGFETTSSTISFTLFELCHNKSIQEKLRREIKVIIKKYGTITYDAFKDMEYLDMCIKETLRKYPILPFLDRRCERDYQIPGTDVVLEKGSVIFIPNWSIQNDPTYFPNPDLYDPERFANNGNAVPAFAYLPFGEGPRNCIGARFGLVSSKLGVAKIISQFDIDFSEKVEYPIKLKKKGLLLAPQSNILLRFTKLDS